MEDYLGISSKPKFSNLLLHNQHLLLSCQVTKFNRFKLAQKRSLVITNKGILNLKKLKLKRRIDLTQLAGVTKSSSGQQFVIHVPNQYDYRYSSPRKNDLIRALSIAHQQTIGQPLIVWQRPEPTLRHYSTTKADRKKGRSRIPPLNQSINYTISLQEQKPQKKETRQNRSQTIFTAPENSSQVTVNDFKILKVLGRGSFGKVMLVQQQSKGRLFAMKSLRKDALIQYDQVQHTKTERMVMQYINHPFLVRLEYAFSSSDKIYFVMAYMSGGELFFHLKEHRKFDQQKARFYVGQVALGLGHLHQQKIVYRDLKPENILLDDQGNAYITDFGMAKMMGSENFTQSFVGTPEYLAPEIINNSGHSFPADWWSFGVLLYEMIVGIPPFYNQNIQLMYELIQHGELRFPQRNPLSDQVIDLIQKLLDRNPSSRLGSRGIQEIKSHQFFWGFDWEALYEKRITPPFRPKISNPESTENFDEAFTSEAPVNSVVPKNRMKIVEKHKKAFEGF